MEVLNLYYVDEKYINYLKEFDNRITYTKNKFGQYIGVGLKYNEFYYFAPLLISKPPILLDKIDIFRIDNGNLGVISIKNMIPVPLECLNEVILQINDDTYKHLLCRQWEYINAHKEELLKKIDLFMNMYLNGNLDKLENEICDFKLLEKKCLEYKNLTK